MESPDPQRLKIYKIGKEKLKKGKEYEVRQADKDFGGNVFNTVRKAEVTGPEGAYSRSFVLRRPRLDFGDNTIKTEDDIKRRLGIIAGDLRTYQQLKDAGIKHVPTTYQLGGVDEGDPVIVMTDYTEGDSKIVLSNNTWKNGVLVESVGNADQLLSDMEADIKAAAKAGLVIPADAYFFIVPAQGGHAEKMEFAIADLDQCVQRKDATFAEMTLYNASEAKAALLLLLINHMPPNGEGKKEFSKKIDAWFENIINSPR